MGSVIKIGLAGIGRAGWGMHCKELEGRESQFKIVAACDTVAERREMMAARYKCKTYARLEDMLCDPDIELVDIATRSCDHYAHATMALNAGKDVFLEKPMCLNYDEAVRLKKFAEQARGNLYIRHNRRFEHGFLHIREIISSGILGDVYFIRLARHGYARRDDWQTMIEYGGGQLLNWGPHIIDHALHFLESPVKNVWSDLKLIAAAGDAEDYVKIVLTGENRRVVDMEISGGTALSVPICMVFGTKGGLSLTGETITMKYLDPAQKLTTRVPNPENPPLDRFGTSEELPWVKEETPVSPKRTYDIWDELYNAIKDKSQFPITLEESVEVMRIISIAKNNTPVSAYKVGICS